MPFTHRKRVQRRNQALLAKEMEMEMVNVMVPVHQFTTANNGFT